LAARIHKGFFTKVKIARELLREKAEEILAQYFEVIESAKQAGDHETAGKMLMWLIEHMPADEEGSRLVDISVDKKQEITQKVDRPAIQIGIQVGGVPTQKQLPPIKAEVVDAGK
jgi:hypothetical protein